MKSLLRMPVKPSVTNYLSGLVLGVVLLWKLATVATAQPAAYAFRQLTTGQGLSNNQVNCLMRDSRGFLWVGTMSGLNRYDGYSFRVFRYSLRDSTTIPNNYVNQLFEDPLGRIWVKTRSGDAVYDPATERFDRNEQPLLQAWGLPKTTLNNVQKDRRGNFWLLTTAGAFYYRTATKRAEPVRHRPNDPQTPADDSLTALHEDWQGAVWLVHRSGLLEKLDARNRVAFRTDVLTKTNRNERHDYRLFIDRDSDLWLFANDDARGVFFFDTQTNQLTHLQRNRPGYTTGPDGAGAANRAANPVEGVLLNNNLVRDITQDEQGMVWIGTDHGGINLIDKTTGTARYLLHTPTDETTLGQNSIYDFYRDTEGIIWVGMHKKGISYYHRNSLRFPVYRHRIADTNSLNYDDVNHFVEDKKGNLWIGTNGGGLSYFDRATNRFTPSEVFTKAAGQNSVVVCLFIDHEQTLWVGTYLGGLYALRGNRVTAYRHDSNPGSVANNNIWKIFEDSQNTLWIGTLGGGLDRFDRQQGQFYHQWSGNNQFNYSNYISSIVEDRAGNLWVGTSSGIAIIDRTTGRFRRYYNHNNDPKGLSNNNIISLFAASQGIIWVGTFDGLNRFDPKTGTFQAFRVEDGLPDNAIQTIVEDASHAIWVGTPNGLSQLTVGRSKAGKPTYRFKNYDESDGLPSRAFNQSAASRTGRGELIFGGTNGFTLFRPETFTPSVIRPSVVLTDFEVFNNSVRPGQEVEGSVPLIESISENRRVTLTHRQNVFSIGFAALNFLNPEKVRYQYKLEGFSTGWLTADSRTRKATFTNLNPGDYVFRVRIADSDNDWQETGIRLNISVLPPFWKSPLAYILYALFTVGLLLLARWILLERARLNFQMEQDRRFARQLHEVDEMKIRFFTNVSHEFRTPLTLIISPLEQLLDKNDNSASQRQLQLIFRNAKRLLNLVNQLLDFRKMEVQGLTLRPTRQDIVGFSREIFHSFSDLSERKHIQFTFEANVSELETVFDPDKLERVLFNLLSNAFKFTPEQGRVVVTLYLPEPPNPTELIDHPLPDAEQWLTIRVADTGIGIAPAQQERIFERFFQSDLPGTLINQGSGIGLAITKEFVQLHGGMLSVESELNRGSTFIIRLPIRTEADFIVPYEPVQEIIKSDEIPANQSVDNGKPAKNGSKKPVILLVEDNEDFRFYLKDNLSRQYTLLEAANGKEGWELAQLYRPDLVVSDVMMPQMDGITLCRRIKAHRRTAHIPVLLLTARSAEERRLEGFETGASDYITKPFNVAILHARIKNLIIGQNLQQKALQPPIDITPGEVAVVSLDEKLIQKALAVVEKNMDNPDFSVEDLSHELGMSRVHLYKKLLAITDKSPIEFIRVIRLRRAAQLLGKSQLTVAEIAYEVGFNSPKNFAKYFKQEFGVIPSQYAAEKQKETPV